MKLCFHMKHIYTSVVIFLLLIICSLQAQPIIHNYSTDDGLLNAQVYDVLQAPNGKMWFSTRRGISIYDGFNWQHQTKANGLPYYSMFKLTLDGRGRIWGIEDTPFLRISYFDKGKWHSHQSALSGYESAQTSPTALATVSVGDSTEVAIGTRDAGVYLLRSGKWYHFDASGYEMGNKISGIVNWKNTLYLATDRGIAVLDREQCHLHTTINSQLPDIKIFGIAIQQRPDFQLDRLWICGDNWLGYIENGTFYLAAKKVILNRNYHAPFIQIQADWQGGIYFGNRVGLAYYNPKTKTLTYPDYKMGMRTKNITGMLLDQEKNLWITSLEGIQKLSNRQFKNCTSLDGMFENEVSALLEYAPGKLIIGHNGGFTLYDGTKFSTHEFYDPSSDHPTIYRRILDFAQDASGRIWLATFALGQLNPDGSFRWVWHADPETRQVNSILPDKQGQIWFTTGQKIFSYDPETQKVKKRFFSKKYYFRNMFSGSDSGIYLCCQKHGLCFFKNDTITAIKADSQIANNTYTYYEDSNGRQWVGTMAGLYRVEQQKLVPGRLNGHEISVPVFAILEDHQNHLWLGTGNGIIRFDGQKLREFRGSHGFVGQEVNRNALVLDHQNRIWIGTDMGLSRYLPETENSSAELVPPELSLTAVKYPKGQKDLTRPQSFLRDENSLTFIFNCISFVNEKAITIRYKLSGFDTEWIEKNKIKTNTLTYGNLPPGKYILSIQAKNDIGIWSPIITSPQIKILPAFVETHWFYLLFAAIVGLLGYGLKNYLAEKRYSAELESREKERTFLLTQSENRLRGQYAALLKIASQNPTHDTSMSNIFQEIAEASATTLDAEGASMWFFDAANSILICSEKYNRLQNEHTTGDHIVRKNAETYFSNILNDKIIDIADIKTNSFFKKMPVYFKKNGTVSLLTVAIRFKGQILGAITFEHIGMPRHWTIDEQNFANSIATHISLLQAAQEQARAELRLKNERNMLYTLIDILPDEIFVKDKNLRFLIINNTLLKKFKAQNYRDIVGKTDHDIIPKRFADFHRKKELKILATGTGYHNELMTNSHKRRYFLTTKIPFHNKSGKISGIVGITQDITQLKRTELSIRQNEAKFRNIFEESPIGIVLLNHEGLLIDTNHASLSMLGIGNKTQLIGYNFLQSQLFSKEIREMIINRKEVEFEKEIDFTSTLKKKHPQITRTGRGCFRLVVTPIKSAPHQPSAPHFLAQVLDITAQKEADERIQNSLKEKETLLLEVHHRVKNNLQIISSLLDMSAMRIKDKKAIELFTDARAKIYTMALIHSQLYKNERFDQIEMGLHLQELGGFLAMIYNHGQDVQFKIDAPDIYLSLTQAIPCTLVLNELISNAYKHAFELNSKGLIQVTMRKNPSNTKMFLSVQDNGSRLQGDLDLFTSSSLGLKLVRNIVQKQLHGSLESRHENGLTIEIEFEIQ